MEIFLNKGCSLNSYGHIGYSNKKRNSIISNCFGAAAFCGNLFTLKWMIEKKAPVNKEFKAQELQNSTNLKPHKEEATACTPLLLAIMKGDSNINVVKFLIKDCKVDIKCTDFQGNSPLHFAVKYQCEEIILYLLKEAKLDVYSRNKLEQTPAALANELGLEKFSNILNQYDNSNNKKV